MHKHIKDMLNVNIQMMHTVISGI